MSISTLKDQSTAPSFVVGATLQNLSLIANQNPRAVIDLYKKCQNQNYIFNSEFGNSKPILREFGLLFTDETVSDTTRNIVLNAIEIHDLRVFIVNPLK